MTPTEKQYTSCLKAFTEWGGNLPSSKRQIIRFLEEKGSFDRVNRIKASSLRVTRSALSDWHKRNWDRDPSSHDDVKRCLRDIERQERSQRVYKDNSRDITIEEAARFITLLTVKYGSNIAIRNRTLACVAYITGYRAGMIGDLEYQWLRNINIEDADIIIDRDPFKTKNEIRSVLPYTGELFCPATWMRQHIKANEITDGFIFRAINKSGNPGTSTKPFHRNNVNSILKDLMSEAQIEGGKLTAHTFRKTMATIGVMNGVSTVELAAQGGWMNASTVENHYVSTAISMLGRAPNALIKATKLASTKYVKFVEHENSVELSRSER